MIKKYSNLPLKINCPVNTAPVNTGTPGLHRAIFSGRGFTLIEVLVSLVILAVGLLGISGMQVTGLRSNHSALKRSQATLFAADMADRIRINNIAFTAGNYNNPTAAITATCQTTTGCTPKQMAENDLSLWNSAIGTTLPSGSGVVCLDSTPIDGASSTAPACDNSGTAYAIKIWWLDNRNAALQRFVVTYQ